jgi:UDP-4-amino-4-deoxy-L-arabinose formyltransferase/UDP-glucuronic acid dehydrogenase (UDP-4-keto-hexauronic acid decarboxylating)
LSRIRVLLVAEEAAGVNAFRLVERAGHSLAAVVTASVHEDRRGATVAQLADLAGVEVHDVAAALNAEFATWIAAHGIELLLNVHSLVVLPSAVVAAPLIGSFNLHPGPLPRYAGLNTPSWAIYNGEAEHAVTVHWMDAGVDTGAIAYDVRVPIHEDDTGLTLSARCARQGLPLIEELLAAAVLDPATIPRRPQVGERRYFGREAPSGGRLDWTGPASRIVNFVHAADYFPFESPWGHPRSTLAGRDVGIVKATRTFETSGNQPGLVGSPRSGGIHVSAGDEWVLVQRVFANEAYVDATEIMRPGDHLE